MELETSETCMVLKLKSWDFSVGQALVANPTCIFLKAIFDSTLQTSIFKLEWAFSAWLSYVVVVFQIYLYNQSYMLPNNVPNVSLCFQRFFISYATSL